MKELLKQIIFGYIITLNEKEELTMDGKAVHIIPAWEWMLK